MALAVTHILVAIVIVSLYRTYFAKPKFSKWYVLLAGIAGLLPDLDYPLQTIFPDYIFHGMFHLVYVAVLLSLIALILYYFELSRKYYLIVGILAFGFFLHLSLDCVAGGYEFFYPFSAMNFCPKSVPARFWPGLDAIILVLWLIHEYYAHKIKAFF